MVRALRLSDADACLTLWNRVSPAKFAIDAAQLSINVFGSPLWLTDLSFAIGDPLTAFAVMKRSGFGMYPGPEESWLHLSCLVYEDPHDGAQLLDAILNVAHARAATKLFYGQDLRHFWPGVPEEMPALKELLASRGFQAGDTNVDLERDMKEYMAPENVYARIGDAQLRACSVADVPLLEEFLKREFPRRWWYDVMNKIEIEGRPECVFGVFVDGVCEGFAITHEDGCKMPIGGAVWHVDMGPGWGSLGPIGVSERVRGRGLGNAILAFGLEGLRDRGVRQCIIDWTTLVDFYGLHGFKPTRIYTPFSIDLA
ncbi:MAG: hypothetical protein JNM85_08695 [Chthonomonas sp.]|nr:hypothetical protein [Chthonomonas sp.]